MLDAGCWMLDAVARGGCDIAFSKTNFRKALVATIGGGLRTSLTTSRQPSAGRAGCPQQAAIGLSFAAGRRRADKEAHDFLARGSLLNGNGFCDLLYELRCME
jgi:hypothetical protein